MADALLPGLLLPVTPAQRLPVPLSKPLLALGAEPDDDDDD